MHLKRFERVLVEGGDKDYCLDPFWSNLGEHVETIQLRHLNVEKQQIGWRTLNRFYRFPSVTAFTHDLDLRIAFEQDSQISPRQRLVINDESLNLVAHSRSICCSGITTNTSTPPSLRLRISS